MPNELEDAPLEQDEGEGGPVKSFVEHLEDLRWVLVRSLTAIGITTLICLISGNYLVRVLKYPLTQVNLYEPNQERLITFQFGTNHIGPYPVVTNEFPEIEWGASDNLLVKLIPLQQGTNLLVRLQPEPAIKVPARTLADKVQLINLGPASGFFVAFQVAIYGGILFASPFVIYYIGSFVLPALRRVERKYVVGGFGVGTFLFLCGLAFCFFILMPLALRASMRYSEWLGFSADQWRAEEYIGFVCKFLLGMGLGFQLPLIVLTMVRMGIIDYQQLVAFRRYMIVLCLILGAVLTTPEILTQVMMAVPLYLLYEISVVIAWYWDRQERKKRAAEGD